MPASIPTIALTTPAGAKAFWEAFPSAPEGPERAGWEDRLIEALALEWFRIRQDLLEERGPAFATECYQLNLRSGMRDSLSFAGFMCKGSPTSASARKKSKAFMSALSDRLEAVPWVEEVLWILREHHGGRVDVDLRSQQATWSSLVSPAHEARNRGARLEQACASASPSPRSSGPRL